MLASTNSVVFRSVYRMISLLVDCMLPIAPRITLVFIFIPALLNLNVLFIIFKLTPTWLYQFHWLYYLTSFVFVCGLCIVHIYRFFRNRSFNDIYFNSLQIVENVALGVADRFLFGKSYTILFSMVPFIPPFTSYILHPVFYIIQPTTNWHYRVKPDHRTEMTEKNKLHYGSDFYILHFVHILWAFCYV